MQLKYMLASGLLIGLVGCGGGGGNGSNDKVDSRVAGPVNPTPTPANCDTAPDLCMHWLMNSTENAAFIKNAGADVLVNVQSVQKVQDAGVEYAQVTSTGIPNYSVVATQNLLSSLLARPAVTSDFISGAPGFSVGDTIVFGENIGYNSESVCAQNAGFGYWPKKTNCPKQVNHVMYFPRSPVVASATCSAGEGNVGLWINGTAVYGWNNNTSYNNAKTWRNNTPISDEYNTDVCAGHAGADGNYHHHNYSSCLAAQAGDTSVGHSPIYGYAADGYPIYGPWEDTGKLAKSSWVTRDYNDATSVTGCGTVGVRSCLLKNAQDPAQGTVSAIPGPSLGTTVVSDSGHSYTATAGVYFEDYYWKSDLTGLGGEYLDQHNGHSDSVRGYHYHVTVTQDADGNLIPAFPYTVGPTFYGKLPAKSSVIVSPVQCAASGEAHT